MPVPPAPVRYRRILEPVAAWLRRHAVQVLAVGKMGKALLLAVVGFGSLHLVNQDLEAVARHWAFVFRIDPENHLLQMALFRLSAVTPRTLRHFGIWSLFFAADQVVEAVGLWLDKAWAKYLMLVATAIFLLDRCYQLAHRFSWKQIPLFLGTTALLLLIIWIIRQDEARDRARQPPSSSEKP